MKKILLLFISILFISFPVLGQECSGSSGCIPWVGLSTDNKPSGAIRGQKAFEYDTGNVFQWIGDERRNGSWIKISTSGAIDTFLQDQTTPAFEHYLYEVLNDATIDTDVLKGANQISLSPGHNFIDPVVATFSSDYIVINYIDTDQPTDELRYRFYQGRVVDVSGDVIFVAIHIPFAIDTAKIDSTYRVNTNMAKVSASLSSPGVFLTTPTNGVKWDITRLMVDMISSSAADDSLFGGGTALTNGIFFGFESDITGFYEYLVNVQDNGGFRSTAFDVNYTTRTIPAGSYGISTRKSFSGRDKYGVAIRLDGETKDRFVTYIQDDMTAAGLELSRLRVKIMGHTVD